MGVWCEWCFVGVKYREVDVAMVKFGGFWAPLSIMARPKSTSVTLLQETGGLRASLEIYLRIGICAASDNQISTDGIRYGGVL